MPKPTKKQIACQNIVNEIVEEAEFLLEDNTLPKNVNIIISGINKRLETNLCDLEISGIIYELEDCTNNANAPECRSIVWNLISKLESLKEKMK